MSDDIDVRPEDALQVAQRALARVNELEEAVTTGREERAELREDLTAIELRLSEVDEDRDYRDLSTDEKIGMVREYAFERATDGRGRTFDYNDIREGLFDGKPSPAHCYDLMRWAAEATGFDYRSTTRENDRLVVDPDEVQRARTFYSAKKASAEGGR